MRFEVVERDHFAAGVTIADVAQPDDDFVVLKSRRMDADADEQKKARAQWTGRLLSLSEVDEQDMTSLTVHERLCELYALSQRAFALSGKPWPQYTRATMPGRLCKLTDND